MSTNFVLYLTCSLGAEVSEDPLDWFSQSLQRMVDIEWQNINPTFFFRYLKGYCHGNQFSGKNGAKLPTPCTYALIALSFQNGMGYCLANMLINSSTNCSTLYEKMVIIGSAVFELKWGRKWKLSCKSAKIVLYCRISQLLNKSLPMFSAFVDVYMQIIKLTSFAVVQGTLLW